MAENADTPQRAREIVIIDDEVEILDILSEDFKEAGYTVFCAENVSSGLALVRNRRPSMVITDLRLPLGGGKDLFDEVIGFPYEMRPKVIFITGNPEFAADQAYHEGAEGFFHKPFSKAQIIGEVKRLLEATPRRWLEAGKKEVKSVLELGFKDLQKAIEKKKINFGRGGIFLGMTQDFPEVGDIVAFQLTFENVVHTIEGSGFVRWVRQYRESGNSPGIGIEFRSLNEESLEFLLNEIKIQEMTPYIPKD